MPQHATKTSWLPGVSGNPSGRPAGSKNKLSHLEPKAIKAMENNLDNDNMQAAMYVFDRINGKTPEINVSISIEQLVAVVQSWLAEKFPEAVPYIEAKLLESPLEAQEATDASQAV